MKDLRRIKSPLDLILGGCLKMPEFVSNRIKEAVIIFPNQLFEYHPGLSKGRDVFLVEDQRFFLTFDFTKKS